MKTTTLIRECQPGDDARVGEILVHAFTDTYARKMPEIRVTEERKAELRAVANRRARAKVLVAEAQGGVVGTVALFPAGSEGSQAWRAGCADLRMLAVDPGYHGQGIAAQLLEAAERMAETWNASGICVHVRRGAHGLGRLYESRGYLREPGGDRELPSVSLDAYFLPLQRETTCRAV